MIVFSLCFFTEKSRFQTNEISRKLIFKYPWSSQVSCAISEYLIVLDRQTLHRNVRGQKEHKGGGTALGRVEESQRDRKSQ
jgi:hypothetical protein